MNDITHCVSSFTSSISNSIVKWLTFGAIDSPFLTAAFKIANMSSVQSVLFASSLIKADCIENQCKFQCADNIIAVTNAAFKKGE